CRHAIVGWDAWLILLKLSEEGFSNAIRIPDAALTTTRHAKRQREDFDQFKIASTARNKVHFEAAFATIDQTGNEFPASIVALHVCNFNLINLGARRCHIIDFADANVISW